MQTKIEYCGWYRQWIADYYAYWLTPGRVVGYFQPVINEQRRLGEQMTHQEMADELRKAGWRVKEPLTQENCRHPNMVGSGGLSDAVSAQMVAAGVEALRQSGAVEVWLDSDELAVEEIYLAMRAASLSPGA